MKKLLLCSILFSSVILVQAQPAHGGRYYANKAVPPDQRKTTPPPAPPSPAPAQSGAASTSTTTKAVPAIHTKTAEEKQEIVERTIEHQRKRAEAGNDIAQYDYGMRFLRGEGVEKNLDTARKWLERSAKQGNTLAQKQLDDLAKKAAQPEQAKP